MKKFSAIEQAGSGIGVSTSARIFARNYYAAQGNTTWSHARNSKLNDLLAMDFSGATPEHRYLLRSGEVAEVRKSGTFVYFAVIRRGTYDIIVIQMDFKRPGKPEISTKRLENLDWSKKMSNNRAVYSRLVKLANRLDQLGAHKEASTLDGIIRTAAEYPSDFNPPPEMAPKEWELGDMEAEREEVERDEEYTKHEEVVDPDRAEELSDEHTMEDKMRKEYDPDTDLLLKMKDVLKRFDPMEFEGYDYSETPYDGQ